MVARIGNVAFDCGDVLKMATFWSAVLGRPIDESSSDEFATIGGADEHRVEPAWYFNRVPEAKRAKNRVHLDLVDPDPATVDRLLALGATTVANHRVGSHRWIVMQDPEGNEFCVAAKSFTG
jgi:Glyoxalase-like domain